MKKHTYFCFRLFLLCTMLLLPASAACSAENPSVSVVEVEEVPASSASSPSETEAVSDPEQDTENNAALPGESSGISASRPDQEITDSTASGLAAGSADSSDVVQDTELTTETASKDEIMTEAETIVTVEPETELALQISPEPAPRILQGIYEIASAADDSLILDVRYCAVEDSDSRSLQLYHALNVNQQKFYVEVLPDDTCRLSVLHSGDVLTSDTFIEESMSVSMAALELSAEEKASLKKEAADAESADAETETAEADGEAAGGGQLWILEYAGEDAFYIRTASGQYLTLEDDYAYCGEPVVLSEYTGVSGQKWKFTKAWISSEATADTDLVNPYQKDGQYGKLRLALKFDSHYEFLTAGELAEHMTETEDHRLVPDDAFLTKWLEQLAERYDTQGVPRQFTTSHGEEITLYKGDFGWKMDLEQTKALLLDNLQTNAKLILEPVWAHKGVTFEKGNDIGDSYVEVDLTNQKVWLYKDGKKLLETDCVTGTLGTDRQTPGGVYSIYYMQSPAVLRGADYTSPVEYWMAYNGNIGLHDANWRSTFGGDIYRTDGSHGCVNLPTEAARLIYETVTNGYPVVSYN